MKKYFKDFKLSDINDNKKFWKTVKPLFGNKIKHKSQTALVEGNNLVTNDRPLAKMSNNFFVYGAATLNQVWEVNI